MTLRVASDRFAVAPFPHFSIARSSHSKWRIEEHVAVNLPGDRLTRPVFKVGQEHRIRWPKEYEAFRAGQSWWTKARLWWHRRRDLRYAPTAHDPALDVAYQTMIENQRSRHPYIDGSIGDDIRKILVSPPSH